MATLDGYLESTPEEDRMDMAGDQIMVGFTGNGYPFGHHRHLHRRGKGLVAEGHCGRQGRLAMENDRATNAVTARGGCPVLAGVAAALTLAEGTAIALAAGPDSAA